MFREERFGEVDEVEDGFVVAVCPERRELKRVACLLRFVPSALLLLDVVCTGGVGIIFGVGAVADELQVRVALLESTVALGVPGI